jgi:hypothetical protein
VYVAAELFPSRYLVEYDNYQNEDAQRKQYNTKLCFCFGLIRSALQLEVSEFAPY